MRNRRVGLTVAGTVLLVVIAAVWLARPADAIIIVNSKAVDSGMFGIAANQTARVHVVNASGFDASDPPCVVEVRFVDSAGEVVKQNQIKIPAGRADFVDYTDPSLTPRTGERKHLRAIVSQMLLREFDQPTAACATTTEVFDNGTGRAGIIIINSHPIR